MYISFRTPLARISIHPNWSGKSYCGKVEPGIWNVGIKHKFGITVYYGDMNVS